MILRFVFLLSVFEVEGGMPCLNRRTKDSLAGDADSFWVSGENPFFPQLILVVLISALLKPNTNSKVVPSCEQDEEIEKMKEICEKNQELLLENEGMKQVDMGGGTVTHGLGSRVCLVLSGEVSCPLFKQKLLLLQLASGQKLQDLQRMPAPSPGSPFDYIPPKVNSCCVQ